MNETKEAPHVTYQTVWSSDINNYPENGNIVDWIHQEVQDLAIHITVGGLYYPEYLNVSFVRRNFKEKKNLFIVAFYSEDGKSVRPTLKYIT